MDQVPTGWDALPIIAAGALRSIRLAEPGIAVLIVLVLIAVHVIHQHLTQKDKNHG